METIIIVLAMLCLVVLSNVICRFLPFISVPLLQILLGCLIGIFPHTLHLHLETEIFMILFVAPLLFMDGKHISNHELWKYRTSIMLLALGLVFVSILICGYTISWLMPTMPLAACFALAAVLSPTDAVSVKAISGRVKMPHKATTIVEGESLLNDASGLVAFKFAIAAQLTGTFSLPNAAVSFIYVAIGGIFVGVVITYMFIFFTNRLHAFGIEDANVHTLIQIITPFTVFLIAEELHLSGILAVVACGIVTSLGRSIIITSHEANIRFISEGAWSNLLFSLNGLVFLFLGMEFTRIAQKRILSSGSNLMHDIGYILVIYLIMIIIRFIWTFTLVHIEKTNQFKNSVILTLSGVRGAITLAACLSVPLTLNNGDMFPARDFMLFVSCGVIFISLLVANIVLPIIAPKTADERTDAERKATRAAIQSAIKHIRREMNENNRQAAYSLITHYKRLLLEMNGQDCNHFSAEMKRREIDILRIGLKAERQELQKLLEECKFDKGVLLRIDKSVQYFANNVDKKFFFWSTLIRWHLFYNKKGSLNHDEMLRVKMHTTDVAILAIKKTRTVSNKEVSRRAIEHLRLILDMYSKIYASKTARKYEDEIKELEFKAKQAEKSKLQEMLEHGEIDQATLSKLRLNIELEEVALLEIDIEDEDILHEEDGESNVSMSDISKK